MSINLTDEIEVKTKKGKLGAAKQIFLEGDTQTVEKEIQDINSRHNTLNTKHESLSRTVQGITVTGGASTANNVTYNNDISGLNAENAQDAIDEVSSMAIYDVSARNNGAVFESLQALLSSSNLSVLIPELARHGGVSIRFVQSSDNKYVQYRLTANEFTTDVTKWQNMDLKPLQTATEGLIENENYYVESDVQAESIGTYNGYINDDGSLTAYNGDTQRIYIFGENDVKYTFNISNTAERTRKYAIYSATRIEDCNSSTLYGSVQSYHYATDFTVTAIKGKLLLVGGVTYNKKEKTVLVKKWKINNVVSAIGTKPIDETNDNLWDAVYDKAKKIFITNTTPHGVSAIEIKKSSYLGADGSIIPYSNSSYSCKIYKLNKGTYKFWVNIELNRSYALHITDSVENISAQTLIGSVQTFTSKQWETVNVVYDNVYLVIGGGLFIPRFEVVSMQEDVRDVNSQQISKLTTECHNNESLTNGHIVSKFFESIDEDGGHVYKAYVEEGEWILASYYARVMLYDNNDTQVNYVMMDSKPAFGAKALRNDGTWKYAIVYLNAIPESHSFAYNRIPCVVNDSTLFLGDSWVHISNNIHEISWVLKTAAWGQGVAGANAELIVGKFCGLGKYTNKYDSIYKTAWENGYFTRTMIFLGANLIKEDMQDNSQKCDGNIPNNVVGNLADLLAGNPITVNKNTISTVADYYALFATNTIGQYAFLLEYLQALQPKKHIYMCGYIPWGQGTEQYGKEQIMINILTDLSKYYGVKFLNTFENSGISIRNNGVFTDDGVHVNFEGAFMYSQRLSENYNIF